MITTPNGTSSWLYEDYISAAKDFVDYIKFSISDNPIITEEAVNALRKQLDPLLARQEIDGEWVNLFSDRVYHGFTDFNIGSYQYRVGEPVYIGLDFNIDKNAWVALQRLPNNTFQIIYEGYGAKTTADAARQILSKFPDNPIVIPDASGNNRIQGTADTQIQLLRQAGIKSIIVSSKNPKRTDRYANTNATFTNALGEHRLYIDSSCTETIRELRELSYKKGTDKPDDKGGSAGHRTDALGYVIWYVTGGKVSYIATKTNNYIEEFKRNAKGNRML